jgi:hypothetical protein
MARDLRKQREPPVGIEPTTYALRGRREPAPNAPPAPTARSTAPTALSDLAERVSCPTACPTPRPPGRSLALVPGERRLLPPPGPGAPALASSAAASSMSRRPSSKGRPRSTRAASAIGFLRPPSRTGGRSACGTVHGWLPQRALTRRWRRRDLGTGVATGPRLRGDGSACAPATRPPDVTTRGPTRCCGPTR